MTKGTRSSSNLPGHVKDYILDKTMTMLEENIDNPAKCPCHDDKNLSGCDAAPGTSKFMTRFKIF